MSVTKAYCPSCCKMRKVSTMRNNVLCCNSCGYTAKLSKKNPPEEGRIGASDIASRKSVKIYDEVLEIRAKKGNNSLWKGEKFMHPFKSSSKAEVHGNPDGSLTIRSKSGKKLWKEFDYDENKIDQYE